MTSLIEDLLRVCKLRGLSTAGCVVWTLRRKKIETLCETRTW